MSTSTDHYEWMNIVTVIKFDHFLVRILREKSNCIITIAMIMTMIIYIMVMIYGT